MGMSKINHSTSLLADVIMVSFIPNRFWARTDQPSGLKGDVLVEKVEWAVLSEDSIIEPLVMQFMKPLEDMT